MTPQLMKNICAYLGLSAAALALASCAVGPNYEKPDIAAPAQYKEAGQWIVAKPSDAIPKGKWWQAFRDPVLNDLAEQVSVSNQTLAAAEARYRQAQAAVTQARSAFFPVLGYDVNAQRQGQVTGIITGSGVGNRYTAELTARWEIDLWGSVRRQVEAAGAAAEASAADLENARLSLQAQLVTNYYLLRVSDTQKSLLDDTVKAFQTSLQVTQNRYAGGVAAKVDVVQAQAQLLGTQANLVDLNKSHVDLNQAM